MPSPDRQDCAVVLSCDQGYLPWALCLIRQMSILTPRPAFDFVLASREALVLPDWTAPLGIRLHISGDLPAQVQAAVPAKKVWPLYRLMLPRELADRYRRILYVDSDILIEGGDLNRLFGIDLGAHPLGAVLDAPFFANATHHAEEYRRAGLPARPYLNAGVLLVDTVRYVAEEVEQRAFDSCTRHPEALVHADQSILNLALQGRFAQLAPCWNWQSSRRLPLATFRYPVFLRHFIGPVKPDRYSGPNLPARHNQVYRDFLAQFMPDRLATLAPPPDPFPPRLGEIVRMTYEHMLARKALDAAFARHPDPYRALV